MYYYEVGGARWITPINMGPLPPFDVPGPPTYDEVYTILPDNEKLIIPVKPRKDYWISNWWSVEVPGLPFVQGASSEHPQMIMTYIMPYYEEKYYESILVQHAKSGNS